MRATRRGRRLVVGAVLTGAATVVWLVPSCVSAPPASDGRMPVCEQEDGSSGVLPCRWDGGPNGTGLHYTITSDGVVNYTGS